MLLDQKIQSTVAAVVITSIAFKACASMLSLMVVLAIDYKYL